MVVPEEVGIVLRINNISHAMVYVQGFSAESPEMCAF